MRGAVQEKAFLLLDDLARHLDDRALALVERADEPVGARELFGQPRLALHRGALSQLGIIAAVDEQARQRAAVNLDRPALHGPENIEEIGRGSGRERVCQYVLISVVAGSLKKKKNIKARIQT